MIVPARVYIIELASFVVAALRVRALKQEAFNFIGRIQCVALLLVQFVGELLQNAANISSIGLAVLIDYIAEDEYLSWTEDICRRPIECAPVDPEAQVAFTLRGETPDRRTVTREVIPALQQEFLVVVQHVQAPFEIAEEHGYVLDPFFVRKVLEPFFLNLVSCRPVLALLFGLQIQLLKFVVRKGKKLPKFCSHASPSKLV